MTFILLIVVSYLMGSIPTSFLFGKLTAGIDIRTKGSGNAGATNAFRVLGTKIGIITLLIDIAKGFLAVLIGKMMIEDLSNLELAVIGISAIIGHIFTIFLKFKGGKGVATSLGVFVAITPIPIIAALIVFVITLSISRFVSLGSIMAVITLLIVELIINIRNSFNEIEFLVMIFIIAVFILIKHKQNIERIIQGNENRIKIGK